MESEVQRAVRFNEALNLIGQHDSKESFKSLIDSAPHMFKGFQLVYSSDNTELDFGFASLSQVEENCKALKKYYCGSGILIYDDEIYEKTKSSGHAEFLLNFSIYFDSNVAAAFRTWEAGGEVRDPRFFELMEYVKRRDLGFNYSFFILERLEELLNRQNEHPFNTIRALKRFEYMTIRESFDGLEFKHLLTREDAGKLAIQDIMTFARAPAAREAVLQQKGIYLILLKTFELYLNNKKAIDQNLCEITRYCLDVVGRFAKLELFFAWKFFKYRTKYNFFSPMNATTPKSLKGIKGMSWDLFFLRFQETITSMTSSGGFSVPFMSSFDNKFVELTKACPIRCTLLDLSHYRMHTLYDDDFEFMEDLGRSLPQSMIKEISDPHIARQRMLCTSFTEELADGEIGKISKKLENYLV